MLNEYLEKSTARIGTMNFLSEVLFIHAEEIKHWAQISL